MWIYTRPLVLVFILQFLVPGTRQINGQSDIIDPTLLLAEQNAAFIFEFLDNTNHPIQQLKTKVFSSEGVRAPPRVRAPPQVFFSIILGE